MLSIRPAIQNDSADIVHIHIESWNAQFTPFLTAQQVLLKDLDTANQKQLWQGRFANEESKTRYTFIAEDNGIAVGYITGKFIDGAYDAELHQIYVLPNAQGHGIGRKLVRNLAKGLYEVGKQSIIVWVMTINPAVNFYQDSLGGKRVTERIIPNGDGILKESGYIWSNIQDLF